MRELKPDDGLPLQRLALFCLFDDAGGFAAEPKGAVSSCWRRCRCFQAGALRWIFVSPRRGALYVAMNPASIQAMLLIVCASSHRRVIAEPAVARGGGADMASGIHFGRIPANAVHLCVDMQRLFAEDTAWRTPWMPRVLPVVVRLCEHKAERTCFTRFIPALARRRTGGLAALLGAMGVDHAREPRRGTRRPADRAPGLHPARQGAGQGALFAPGSTPAWRRPS